MKKFYIVLTVVVGFFLLTAATYSEIKPLLNTSGRGSPGAGFTATEYGDGSFHKTVLKCTAKSISTDDVAGSGANAHCTLYTFPKGAIVISGAFVNMSCSRVATGIAANADGDVAIGTVIADTTGTPLSSTEVDIMPNTAIAQLVTGAGVIHGQKAAASYHDGTTTAKTAYLNILFDDADSSADDHLLVTGTVTLYWINQGTY